MAFLLGGLAFLLTGYALAFGKGHPIVGYTYFAGVGLPHSQYTHLFFQVKTPNVP
jgi:hypothetical protein